MSETQKPWDDPRNSSLRAEFALDFRTKDAAGLIRYVKVTIEESLMDHGDSVRIDLADHPLYKSLQRYVKDNPR